MRWRLPIGLVTVSLLACSSSANGPTSPGAPTSGAGVSGASGSTSGAATGASSSVTASGGAGDSASSGAAGTPEMSGSLALPADGGATIPVFDATVPPGNGQVGPSPDAGGTSPWLVYNDAPSVRSLSPVSASVHGTVDVSDGGVLSSAPNRIHSLNSSVTYDFAREVAGIVSFSFGAASDSAQKVGLAFTESSQYIGTTSDDSTGVPDASDGSLVVPVTASTAYTMPASKLRGGFRYLTIYLATSGWADVGSIRLNFTAAPTMPVPSAYPNYFYSNDTLLNRVWYAGAYTVQLNTISPTQGRAWPGPTTTWDNSATIGVGDSVLVDGAKRDRTVWPGDLGVSVGTAYVSTGDLDSTKNALDTLFAGQDTATGEFPRSGPPLNGQNGHTSSDTYHMWTLLGAYNYFLYSGDKAWLDKNWAAHKKGLAFSVAKIGTNGLMQVTLTKDWGRLSQGGANIAANALLYRVLLGSAQMATAEGDSATATSYTTTAAAIKTAANSLLWDSAASEYRDNPTSTLYPQDGNSLAIWFGLVDTTTKAQSITTALRTNWNGVGARTPECDPTRADISPFTGSMEVAARFVANDDAGALALIRLEWGYMLNAVIGTGSSFWEGYEADGGFGYGGSYMSAAHGWSSGPTFALTNWVLGVAPDSAAGVTYHVTPHSGDLTHVEGALTMAAGKKVTVSYDHPACGDFTLHVDSSTNTGSTGVIGIPKFGQSRVITWNGTKVWDGTQFVPTAGITSADQDANAIYFRGLAPAAATLAYSPKVCP